MKIFTTIDEIRAWSNEHKRGGKTVGFVPTMGYLHRGHVSLIEASVEENNYTIVSIFVNPTQFGPNEDLDKYPRDITKDTETTKNAGVDVLFVPLVNEIYPKDYSTFVNVEEISDYLCGSTRLNHFKGVATVVTKLFNICNPTKAYFGQKDYQQAVVIQRMVRDLNMDLTVVVCPIVREADGLAMSSRNVYLSHEERAQSLSINISLKMASKLVDLGERNTVNLIEKVTSILEESDLISVEYVEVVDVKSLHRVDKIESRAVLAIAVKIGSTRLIDNIILEV
ncbi:MAG: pantoate--beta-alanine ligase [Bacillota bacterium]